MQVIPAIDIKDGKVVRLIRGRTGTGKVYFDSPLEAARKWASFDVDLIHVVDLDGALDGNFKNFDLVKQIVREIKPKVELGGGIRSESIVREALGAGIDKVVIGTKALDEKFLSSIAAEFKDRIVAGIDARGGYVYTKGWVSKTKTTAKALIKKIEDAGIRRVNYTDISKDGTLEGPNVEGLKELLKETSMDIIASGGTSSTDDIRRLKALEADGLKGIIIGTALYEGRVDLREAIEICKS